MIVIEIKASEIDTDCDTIKIEVPGAVQIEDAVCAKCGAQAHDVEQDKLDAIMQAARYVCDTAIACCNEDKDFRKIKIPQLIDNMMKQFAMTDDEIASDKTKNIETCDVRSKKSG